MIEISHGSPIDFRGRSPAGLWIDATSNPDSPLLDLFYAGYDQSFVLANEKERKSGFAECLALNVGEAYAGLAARFGPYRELIIVVRGAENGEPCGGANFIAYPLGEKKLALNLNYIFVHPAHRRQGHFRRIVETVGHVARTTFELPIDTETWIFIEQNDPIRMSAEDYQRDTDYSGLDQVERLGMWAALGARIVDFPYVQPPLSASQEPDENLLYSVLGVANSSSLEAKSLLAHLERFFGISVLKGQSIENCPSAVDQLAELQRLDTIGASVPLVDPGPAVAHLRKVGIVRARCDFSRMLDLMRLVN